MEIEEAKELLLIDKNSLDDVCLEQSSLFEKIGSTYVNAISKRDKAKEEFHTIDAQLAITKRKEADLSNIKLTEAKLAEMVQVHPEHEEAMERYFYYKHEADKWGVLKESFSQRKDMIEIVCKLYLTGYFNSETSVKESKYTNITEVRAIRERQSKKRQRKKINQ